MDRGNEGSSEGDELIGGLVVYILVGIIPMVYC